MAGPGMGGGLGEVSGLSGVSGPSASGEVPEPHAAPEERRCGPFVGRATERRAIQRLLSDAAETERLRAAGSARAALFTWERTARLTLESYRRALGRE